MIPGIVTMMLFVLLLILFVKPGDRKEIQRRELEAEQARIRRDTLALAASNNQLVEQIAQLSTPGAGLDFASHEVRLGHERAPLVLQVSHCDARSAHLVIRAPLLQDSPFHGGLPPTRLDEEVWVWTGLAEYFASSAHLTLSDVFNHHNTLYCRVEISPASAHIAFALCETLQRHLSITRDDWPQEHRARVTRPDEVWHAASSSMDALIERHGEKPDIPGNYNHNALSTAMRHAWRIRPPGWLGADERARVMEVLGSANADERAKLDMLDFLCASCPEEFDWNDERVATHIAELACARPEQKIAFTLLLEGHITPHMRFCVLHAQLAYLVTCTDAMSRLRELLTMPWLTEHVDVHDEVQPTEPDETATLLAVGIMRPGADEFLNRSARWLERQARPSTAFFLWEEIVEHQRAVLMLQATFVELLVKLAASSLEDADTFGDMLLPSFADSPYLIAHLRAHMPDTKPHTSRGWMRLADRVLEHLPSTRDDDYFFMLELVFIWPDAKKRKVWLDSQDPDDTRYMAFQILHEETPEIRRLYLVQKLTALLGETLPQHVYDALLYMVEHDRRPSIYAPPLARLGALDDAYVLRRLHAISAQRRQSRNKRDAIEAEVTQMRARLNARGGELSLSQHDERRGGLSAHEQ